MSINIFKVILNFAGRCKGKMILSVICSLISVAVGFVPYIAVYKILSEFFANQGNLRNFIYWCLVCFGAYVLKLLFFEISTTLSHISAYTILEAIRLQLARKLLKLPLGFVLNKPIGKLKSIMIDRVETIELPLAHLIPEGIAYTIAPIGVFAYLLSINWVMALASLITFPVVMIASGPSMRKINEQYKVYIQSSNYMNSVMVEYIEGIEVIKTFNQSDKSYEKYSNAIDSFRNLTVSWYKSTWFSGNLLTSVLPSTFLGTVPVGMYLYTKGVLTPAQLTLCIILSLGLIAPLMGLTSYINALKIIQFAVAETDEILKTEELSDTVQDVEITDHSIQFHDVSFSYKEEPDANEESEKVLDKIKLTIPNGSFTALIGPSGGGKSTTARLISRFWDTAEGKITIGGKDIKEIPLSQLSRIISYVSQDNFLFNCSLKDNIRLGRLDADDEEVYAAARAAQCDEFIKLLDNGYDTMAGEAGDKLSGGEKQRIAIARMILRNAPIIILDEATAFTDPENEEQIQEAIGSLTKGKTLLVIAHRLSTIKNADNIVILKEGLIETNGTHEQLLHKSPLYQNMWQSHIGAKKWAVNCNAERGDRDVSSC